jgi:hypothetical protein
MSDLNASNEGAEGAAGAEAPAEPPPPSMPARPLCDPEQPLTVRDLFNAGVHFGHQTKRWNPKMRPYLYGSRDGIHIIDLDQTVRLFKRAFSFVNDTIARGGHILFVGTKRQAQDIVREEASRANRCPKSSTRSKSEPFRCFAARRRRSCSSPACR